MAKRIGAPLSGRKPGDQPYIPDRGDLIFISFSPQTGREQAGRRPALVLSPRKYNSKSGLCVACPITSQVKAYPFEVALPTDLAITGVVLSDQIKSTDWQMRKAEYVCDAPEEVIAAVQAKLKPLLGM